MTFISKRFPVFIKLLQILSHEIFIPSYMFHNVVTSFTKTEEDSMIQEIRHVIPDVNPQELQIIGCGTVGRVYRYHDYAIKVQIPGMLERFHENFMKINKLFKVADFLTCGKYRFYDKCKNLMLTFEKQFDFEKEVESMNTYSNDIQKFKFKTVFTPRVYKHNKNIIVMEYVEGDLFKKEHVTLEIAQMLISNMFLFELSHVDLHSGNMIITKDRRVCVIDFGLTEESCKNLQYERLVYNLIKDDIIRCANIVALSCHNAITKKKFTTDDYEVIDLQYQMVHCFHFDDPDLKFQNMSRIMKNWFIKYPYISGNGYSAFCSFLTSVHFFGFIKDPVIFNDTLKWFITIRKTY